MTDIVQPLVKEMEAEAGITRKILQRIPADKFDWKPHPKSMSMLNLAVHIAELPSWVQMAFTSSELDFATMNYTPTTVTTTADVLALFEHSFSSGLSALRKANEKDLLPSWTLRTGDKIHAVYTKYELVRHAFAQTTHHRAQLGVYLRLLDIPIPGSYGPSADEPTM